MEILPKIPLNSGNHPHLHHEDSKIEKKTSTSPHCVLFTIANGHTTLAAVACSGLELFIANDVTVYGTINK